jgi:hypothetical protein
VSVPPFAPGDVVHAAGTADPRGCAVVLSCVAHGQRWAITLGWHRSDIQLRLLVPRAEIHELVKVRRPDEVVHEA